METSSTATSGSIFWTNSTAARPSGASPTHSMSACDSTSARKPSRTSAWSSAKKTRSLLIAFLLRLRAVGRVEPDGDAHEDGRAASGRALDLDRAVDERRALGPPDEAHAAHFSVGFDSLGVKAAAVVLHDEHDVAVAAFEQHVDARGRRVLGDVVQSLLRDAVQRRLDQRFEARVAEARRVEVDLHAE